MEATQFPASGTIKVDVVEFEKMLSRGTTRGSGAGDRDLPPETFGRVWHGGEPFEEWLLTERERLWERALEGMASCCRFR